MKKLLGSVFFHIINPIKTYPNLSKPIKSTRNIVSIESTRDDNYKEKNCYEAIFFITLIQSKPIDSKYLEYTFYFLHRNFFF